MYGSRGIGIRKGTPTYCWVSEVE